MAVRITPGNTDDRKPPEAMTAELEGRMFADKGYISKALFQRLWQRGLHLITGICRNMKTTSCQSWTKSRCENGSSSKPCSTN